MRRRLCCGGVTKSFLLVILLALAARTVVAEDKPLVGIGHIPVAVKNLRKASADYEALGFTLKPGRLHDNSLNNNHAKYPDGTELELITASKPLDDLAKKYLRLIAAGDGPAFLALYAPDMNLVETRLTEKGIGASRTGGFSSLTDPALDYLFFVGDNRSPTDLPEHFVHANSSLALIGVWIADADNGKLTELLVALGARLSSREVQIPVKQSVTVAQLSNGEVTLLPASARIIKDRPIVGAVFEAADLDALIEVAGEARLPVLALDDGGKRDRVFMVPVRTHGLWLEFRQARQSR